MNPPISFSLLNSIDDVIEESLLCEYLVYPDDTWDIVSENYVKQKHRSTYKHAIKVKSHNELSYIYKSKLKYFSYFLVIYNKRPFTGLISERHLDMALGDYIYFYSVAAMQKIRHEHAIIVFRNPKSRQQVEKLAHTLYGTQQIVATPIYTSIAITKKYMDSQCTGTSFEHFKGTTEEILNDDAWMLPSMREKGFIYVHPNTILNWNENGMPTYYAEDVIIGERNLMNSRAVYSEYLKFNYNILNHIHKNCVVLSGDEELAKKYACEISDGKYYVMDINKTSLTFTTTKKSPIKYLFQPILLITYNNEDENIKNEIVSRVILRKGDWGNVEVVVLFKK